MSQEAFVRAILDQYEDPVPRLVFADYLDEHAQPDLAFAYRWMAKNQKRPTPRPGLKPWAWYPAVRYIEAWNKSRESHLPVGVFFHLRNTHINHDHRYYKSYEEAVADLAFALTQLRAMLEVQGSQ